MIGNQWLNVYIIIFLNIVQASFLVNIVYHYVFFNIILVGTLDIAALIALIQ